MRTIHEPASAKVRAPARGAPRPVGRPRGSGKQRHVTLRELRSRLSCSVLAARHDVTPQYISLLRRQDAAASGVTRADARKRFEFALADLRSQASHEELAKRYQSRPSTVSRARRALGIRWTRRRASIWTREAALALLARFTVRELAEREGVSVAAVYLRVHRLGIPLRAGAKEAPARKQRLGGPAQAPPTKLARQIRHAREARGLTVAAAAARVGVSFPTWRRWECGERAPRPASRGRIAAALGARLAD